MGRTLAVTLTLLVFGYGCSKPSGDGSAPTASATASATVAPSSTATEPPIPSGGPSRPVVSLQDKFEVERENRPQGTPRAEDVYAALEKAGLRLSEKQQHVASVFGARYCLGAKGDGDMAYSVCEYADDAAAVAGREASLKTLASIPNRDIYTNKKTTLTIRQPGTKTAASEAAAKQAAALFAKL